MTNSFGPWATAVVPGSRSPLDAFWRRRMAMLATIQQASIRPSRGQRARLALLAGLLLALPTADAVGTLPAAGPAAPQDPQPPGVPGALATGGPQRGDDTAPPAWQVFQDLGKAYALADGELVRAIRPPFPPVRAVWLRDYAARPLDESQVLAWSGERLNQVCRLPRTADGYPLRELLGRLFDVSAWDVVDPQNLLVGHKIQADFVVRSFFNQDERQAKLADPLGAVLRRDLKVPVKLNFREVELPHVIASGILSLAQLPGTGFTPPVAVFGKEPPPAGTPVREIDSEGLLMAVGDYVGLAVIDNGVQGPFGMTGGRGGRGGRRGDNYPGRILVPHTWEVERRVGGPSSIRIVVQGDRKREGADVETVLKRVEGQTGLTLRVEKRRVRALVVEKAE